MSGAEGREPGRAFRVFAEPPESSTMQSFVSPASLPHAEGEGAARGLVDPIDTHDRNVPDDGRVVFLRSLPTSGTVQPSRTLSEVMPICRIHVPPQDAAPQPARVRLSHFIVTRRATPRAANDNRPVHSLLRWQWVVGIAAVPTLTAVLVLSRLF